MLCRTRSFFVILKKAALRHGKAALIVITDIQRARKSESEPDPPVETKA